MQGRDIFAKHRENIDKELYKLWPDGNEQWFIRMSGDAAGIVTDSNAQLIANPVTALLRRGGKRWRPFVMAFTAQGFGVSPLHAAELAPLVELPHTGSLIVDDIEDAAEFRRGLPAIHLMYDVDTTINSANLAYFAPTVLIDSYGHDESIKYQLYKSYARAMRGVHMGQGLDIIWHKEAASVPSVDEYKTMCRLKTGALAAMAAEVGALMAGKDEAFARRVGKVWQEIGLGFQIMDDVGNLYGTIKGKLRGDDIIEGKKSLPVILFYEQNPAALQLLQQLFEEAAKERGEIQDRAVQQAVDLLTSGGALEKARLVGLEILNEGKAELQRLMPQSEARAMLFLLIDQFIESLS
jgi:geranylgeranyl pyrophosphate synthase